MEDQLIGKSQMQLLGNNYSICSEENQENTKLHMKNSNNDKNAQTKKVVLTRISSLKHASNCAEFVDSKTKSPMSPYLMYFYDDSIPTHSPYSIENMVKQNSKPRTRSFWNCQKSLQNSSSFEVEGDFYYTNLKRKKLQSNESFSSNEDTHVKNSTLNTKTNRSVLHDDCSSKKLSSSMQQQQQQKKIISPMEKVNFLFDQAKNIEFQFSLERQQKLKSNPFAFQKSFSQNLLHPVGFVRPISKSKFTSDQLEKDHMKSNTFYNLNLFSCLNLGRKNLQYEEKLHHVNIVECKTSLIQAKFESHPPSFIEGQKPMFQFLCCNGKVRQPSRMISLSSFDDSCNNPKECTDISDSKEENAEVSLKTLENKSLEDALQINAPSSVGFEIQANNLHCVAADEMQNNISPQEFEATPQKLEATTQILKQAKTIDVLYSNSLKADDDLRSVKSLLMYDRDSANQAVKCGEVHSILLKKTSIVPCNVLSSTEESVLDSNINNSNIIDASPSDLVLTKKSLNSEDLNANDLSEDTMKTQNTAFEDIGMLDAKASKHSTDVTAVDCNPQNDTLYDICVFESANHETASLEINLLNQSNDLEKSVVASKFEKEIELSENDLDGDKKLEQDMSGGKSEVLENNKPEEALCLIQETEADNRIALNISNDKFESSEKAPNFYNNFNESLADDSCKSPLMEGLKMVDSNLAQVELHLDLQENSQQNDENLIKKGSADNKESTGFTKRNSIEMQVNKKVSVFDISNSDDEFSADSSISMDSNLINTAKKNLFRNRSPSNYKIRSNSISPVSDLLLPNAPFRKLKTDVNLLSPFKSKNVEDNIGTPVYDMLPCNSVESSSVESVTSSTSSTKQLVADSLDFLKSIKSDIDTLEKEKTGYANLQSKKVSETLGSAELSSNLEILLKKLIDKQLESILKNNLAEGIMNEYLDQLMKEYLTFLLVKKTSSLNINTKILEPSDLIEKLGKSFINKINPKSSSSTSVKFEIPPKSIESFVSENECSQSEQKINKFEEANVAEQHSKIDDAKVLESKKIEKNDTIMLEKTPTNNLSSIEAVLTKNLDTTLNRPTNKKQSNENYSIYEEESSSFQNHNIENCIISEIKVLSSLQTESVNFKNAIIPKSIQVRSSETKNMYFYGKQASCDVSQEYCSLPSNSRLYDSIYNDIQRRLKKTHSHVPTHIKKSIVSNPKIVENISYNVKIPFKPVVHSAENTEIQKGLSEDNWTLENSNFFICKPCMKVTCFDKTKTLP